MSDIKDPPKGVWPTLKSLGPGMILTGSIVGSGELIATTIVGANTGFTLLWIIVIGCIIKVFTQIEFGRNAVTHSEPTLTALNRVPGPRFKVNWVVWCWVIMTLLVIGQLGGIVGGVGQALALAKPITANGEEYNKKKGVLVREWVEKKEEIKKIKDGSLSDALKKTQIAVLDRQIVDIRNQDKALKKEYSTDKKIWEFKDGDKVVWDEIIWATLIACITAFMMWFGRYGFVKGFVTTLVVGFTIVTVVTLIMIQGTTWAITGTEFMNGLKFSIPEAVGDKNPLLVALGAFGIIGVGAAELIFYPYWCLEQGYAKATGLNDNSDAWLTRAKGWMKVMYTDAWVSMVIYTASTIVFFLLGAAVLNRIDMQPEGSDLVRFLSEMYVPVFGDSATIMFLLGAVAVLFSTFFVACDGNARVVSDCFGLFKFHKGDENSSRKWAKVVSVIWPFLCLIVYLLVKSPAQLVLASGLAQAFMLPVLGISALFFRYRRVHESLKPNKIFDTFLALSVVSFVVIGIYAGYSKIEKTLKTEATKKAVVDTPKDKEAKEKSHTE